MGAKIVLPTIGERFGSLLTIAGEPRKRGRAFFWPVRCDCGKTVYRQLCVLKQSKSCGCKTGFKHGQGGTNGRGGATAMYVRWQNMKNRCGNAKADHAKRYKARGIKVCDRWAKSFPAFLADILAEIGKPPTAKHQIDRTNNNRDYEPGNVRWATRFQQQRNTGRTHFITHKGRTLCLTDWAKELGIPRERLSRRIHLGWSVEQALKTPIGTPRKR